MLKTHFKTIVFLISIPAFATIAFAQSRIPTIGQVDTTFFSVLLNEAGRSSQAGRNYSGKSVNSDGDSLIVGDAVGRPGDDSVRVQVDLVNTQKVRGIQFEIKDVPDLLTSTAVKTTERTNNLSIFSLGEKNGVVAGILASFSGATIETGSGSVLEIIYSVSSQASVDRVELMLQNIIVADTTLMSTPVTLVNGIFTILDPTLQKGDVNNDGEFNVKDLIRMINIILDIGEIPTDIEKMAADVNGDGIINVTDVIGLINIILGVE